MSQVVRWGLVVWLCLPGLAHAQTVLTLQDVLMRARARAGAVVVARARVAEAESSLSDASLRFRENPEVAVSVGPRSGDTRTTDLGVSFLQPFETGGRRQARIDGVRAGVERQRADVDRVAREAAFQSALVFLDGVAAAERVRITEQADAVGRQLLEATERRFAAGDVAAIDLNLSRIEAGRSAAALRSARAEWSAALAALRSLLRLPEDPIDIRGSLDSASVPSLADLEAGLERRPDFAVLRAEVLEAEAQTRLGQGLATPDLGVSFAYEREATDSIVLGGLTVRVPAFQRGQGTLALGLARASRARLELDIARETARRELRAAYATHQQLAEAATALARDTEPAVADNDDLGQRSYDAGEISLMDLLVIRRIGLDARLSVIERRLQAARSRLTVDFIAGVLP